MKFILILFFPFFSCNKDAPLDKEQKQLAQEVATKQISYLALGDSYTIGESVTQQESYPYQLAKFLQVDQWSVDNIEVIAKSGWTTANLSKGIIDRNIVHKFDIVTLLIGVNNQFQGSSQVTYRREFVELLNTALNYANGDTSKVFVLSIPDWSVTPFAFRYDKANVSQEIDEFNAINKEECEKAGVDYTDITETSRTAKDDQTLIANDGLHPSDKMYRLWMNLLAPKVLIQLKK